MEIVKTKWTIDPAHSEIIFKVRHLMITNVKGEFRTFEANLISEGNDFSNADVSVTIDASSIFTNSDARDAHLKSADFFDVEKFPQITFKSTEVKKIDSESFKLVGDLTMKGISNIITLDVDFGGVIIDPYGKEKAGFSISGKFIRKDWGLTWNAALESGGVMVSDEVRFNAEVQFIKEA
ncbi:MAG: YceI family protein [Ferruginibacter sp.]